MPLIQFLRKCRGCVTGLDGKGQKNDTKLKMILIVQFCNKYLLVVMDNNLIR